MSAVELTAVSQKESVSQRRARIACLAMGSLTAESGVHVGDGQQAGQRTDRVVLQSPRVTGAIAAFVVARDRLGQHRQRRYLLRHQVGAGQSVGLAGAER